jgi:hypothetical protein
LIDFFLREINIEKILDAIELTFRIIENLPNQSYENRRISVKLAESSVQELNARFQEHGVGFQYIDRNIIRIDSELIHSEVVKPALHLLHDRGYKGAQAEFLKAHEHYRHGNTKEALNESLKALESTLKTICDKRQWSYDPKSTCSALIQLCFDRGLIDGFWSSHFSALRSTLESGVPTARNKLGGHGQGTQIVEVPLHLAAYILHMTAACIVFLAESEKRIK